MSMEGSNVGNAVTANAIENWDDDNAFDFSSISAEGDNLRPSLNADLSAGFSDTDGDSDSEGDWDNLVQSTDLEGISLSNVSLNDDDASSSTVSNQFLKLRAVFSAEGDEEEEDDHPSNFLLAAIKEGESRRNSEKKEISPGEILIGTLPEMIQEMILKVETLEPDYAKEDNIEHVFRQVDEQDEVSENSSSYEHRAEYKKTLRDLAVKCYEIGDYNRAAKYHLSILHQCKYFENKNEYMYVVEAIAKIRCCQGKFLKGKKELKNWIACMRQKYNRLRRDIDKGRCKDNLMRQMERKKLLESIQSLEITLARFCLNAGWPGYASTMLLRLAKSIEIDDVNDIDNALGKLEVVHLWLAESFLQGKAPSRALIALNRLRHLKSGKEKQKSPSIDDPRNALSEHENLASRGTSGKVLRTGVGSSGRLINSFFRQLFEPIDPPIYACLKARYELDTGRIEDALNTFVEWHEQERTIKNYTKIQQAKNYEFKGDIYEHATRLGNSSIKFPLVLKIDVPNNEKSKLKLVLEKISDCVIECVRAYRKAFDLYSSIGDHVGATRMALEIASVQTHVLVRDFFHEAPVGILFTSYEFDSNMAPNLQTKNRTSPISLLRKVVGGNVQNTRIAYAFSDLEHPATFAYSRTRAMGIPIEHINSCLLLAEFYFLKGQTKNAFIHWGEAIDLFVYLFVDGSNVPLLRNGNMKIAKQLFRILGRAMLLHFALPRLKVNQYIYLFDLYIQGQREMIRRSEFSNSCRSAEVTKGVDDDAVNVFDDDVENNYIFQPLFSYNFKVKRNGRTDRVVKGSMKNTKSKWDSVIKSYESDATTCEFCCGCLYRIQLVADGNSKKNSPKEIYELVKQNLFDLAHTMEWRRTVCGEQPQPNTTDMCFDFIRNEIVNYNLYHSCNAGDFEGSQIDTENLLRLVYIVNVENFIMVYSPQSGRRSLAMAAEVELPKESILQRKISIELDMDKLMEDDNSCAPTNEDISVFEDPKQKTDGTASKKESPVSLATEVPRENIGYLRLTLEAQNVIVGMLSNKSAIHKGNVTQNHGSSVKASYQKGKIISIEALHLKSLAASVIEHAEMFQNANAVPVTGAHPDDSPTEPKKLTFFQSLLSRRIVIPKRIRSMRKHDAPLVIVSSPLLKFLPLEDTLDDICDVTRSHSLIFPLRSKFHNLATAKKVHISGKSKNNGVGEKSEQAVATSGFANNVLPTRQRILNRGNAFKVPQCLSISYATRRPVLQQTNENVRRVIAIRRLMEELNHETTRLTGGDFHPMNPNPHDVDHLKFHEKRLFSSPAYFYSFLNRRYAAHCDNVPFQSPLVKFGERPSSSMFNNGFGIKKLFHHIHVGYRITGASDALSWFEKYGNHYNKSPVLLFLTYADMVECSEVLLHIVGFRPDICIIFVPAEHFYLTLSTFAEVFNWGKKAADRDADVVNRFNSKQAKRRKSKSGVLQKGSIRKSSVELNTPEEWRSIRSMILSTSRILRHQSDVHVVVQNLPAC